MTAAERLEALMTPRKRVIETTAPHRPLWAPPLASNTGIYLIESFEGGRVASMSGKRAGMLLSISSAR
jgi:hypothetical protein